VLILWLLLFLIVCGILAYHKSSRWVWLLGTGSCLVLMGHFRAWSYFTLIPVWTVFAVIYTPLVFPLLRRRLITAKIFDNATLLIPTMSATEKQALDAGSIGFEGEIFTGSIDWAKFFERPKPTLSEEEQAFLQGPVHELCSMVNDWEITHTQLDMSSAVWDFIKKHQFLAMIIPKEYGGLGFSNWGHASVLMKLAGCSGTVGVSVSVPNSLGPAELLLDYGTEAQKNYYLPRLASGEEIPCFALTAPTAGSDAASIPDYGIICHGEYEGKSVIGIRLNFNKRYITLAPVATLIGLAFKLYDPEHLLGETENIGITVALLPRSIPGLEIGRRHFPLNSAFLNGPVRGHDVFIPLDFIIGGPERAGQGWPMLMERLATGRAISLPSLSVGGARAVTFASGAYARIRKQFKLPIGRFEGIMEKLATIAGLTYLTDASVQFTVSALDAGEKPAVASAMMKYHATENMRLILNDAMDIHGGKGICLGPSNYLGRGYQQLPIAITVEGANILTRNLIIFGQGATRCHPFVQTEMTAIAEGNLKAFDLALFGHVAYAVSHAVRSFCYGLTGARFVKVPTVSTRAYLRAVTRFSSALVIATDIAMLCLGGKLKLRERLSARLGDVLSYLYLTSTVVKRYQDEGLPAADLPLVDWSCQYLLYKTQNALQEFIENFPSWWGRCLLRLCIFPLGQKFIPPSDSLSHVVAQIIQTPNGTRSRLSSNLFLGGDEHALGLLANTLEQVILHEKLEAIVQKAFSDGTIKGMGFGEQVIAAGNCGIITKEQMDALLAMHQLRERVIAVDDFSTEELKSRGS